VVALLAGPGRGLRWLGGGGSTLTAANITNPACGADIAGVVESMRQGRTYVNVHSTAHPGGVARGQIVKA
jgi:hypothetical protein